MKVEQIEPVHLGAHRLRPVGKNSLNGYAGLHAEGEVDVGEPVGSPFGLRADDGCGDDAGIRLSPCEEATLYALAILGSEEHHGSRRYLSTLLRLEGSYLARLPTGSRVSRAAEVPIRDAQISHAECGPPNAVWNAR
ncbi:MAG: hypothetical protein ABSB52_16310, partial [Acidimicrobiales bacterium]